MLFHVNPFFKSWYCIIPFSLFYASVLSSLPSSATTDYSSYLSYVSDSSFLLFSRPLSSLSFYANEPIWLLLNYIISFIFPPDGAVRAIIFASSFIASCTLLRFSGVSFFWLLLALISPISIKNSIFHIRQGLAVSLFLLGFYSQSKTFSSSIIILTPFIHSSFFFVLPLYLFSEIRFLSFTEARFKTFLYMLLAFLTVFSGLFFSSFAGARQVLSYSGADIHVSGIGFFVWLSVFILFIAQGRVFLNNFTFQVSVLSLYLSSYFFFSFSARIFESCFLLVFASGFSLTGDRYKLFAYLISIYFIATWTSFYPQLAL